MNSYRIAKALLLAMVLAPTGFITMLGWVGLGFMGGNGPGLTLLLDEWLPILPLPIAIASWKFPKISLAIFCAVGLIVFWLRGWESVPSYALMWAGSAVVLSAIAVLDYVGIQAEKVAGTPS